MPNFKVKSYLNLILIISFISLFFAYFLEYILGYQPCNLCLLERIPYILSMVLIIFNLIYKKNEKFFIILLILLFIFSCLISIYHFGIEQEFFKESTVCGLNNTTDVISKEELLLQLNKVIISCKDVTFRVLGLSLTSINVIISFLILIILIKIYNNYDKIKK